MKATVMNDDTLADRQTMKNLCTVIGVLVGVALGLMVVVAIVT